MPCNDTKDATTTATATTTEGPKKETKGKVGRVPVEIEIRTTAIINMKHN